MTGALAWGADEGALRGAGTAGAVSRRGELTAFGVSFDGAGARGTAGFAGAEGAGAGASASAFGFVGLLIIASVSATAVEVGSGCVAVAAGAAAEAGDASTAAG